MFWIAAMAPIRVLSGATHPDGELRLEIVDSSTGKPCAARMHLYSGPSPGRKSASSAPNKRPVKLGIPGSAEFGGHFYLDGSATLPLHVGTYTFDLEAGPEYLTESGHFEIERHADDTKRIEMKRVVDLAKEGWFGGDLDVHRRPADMKLIMRAEGLSVAPIIESKDEADLRILPSKIAVAPTPYAWNLPIWLAEGKLSAIELIHHHSLRDGVLDNEKDGRPRDKTFYPGAHGNGRWSEAAYYHVLNCGFHVPPVAGSGSGLSDNPVGTNRVYVYCGSEFSPEAWWEGIRAGHVFVTNGPLLRTTVEGEPPGHTFGFPEGQSLTVEIGLNLATAVPVDYLQIIKNGSVEAEIRLAEWKGKKGRLPPVHFDDSGWFLVRAVTSNPKTYQFASSGPYYVEKAGQPRISRTSVKFFMDWLEADQTRVSRNESLDAAKREELLAAIKSARSFFERLSTKANAD